MIPADIFNLSLRTTATSTYGLVLTKPTFCLRTKGMKNRLTVSRDKKSVMGPGCAETTVYIGGWGTTIAKGVMIAAFGVWVILTGIICDSADFWVTPKGPYPS